MKKHNDNKSTKTADATPEEQSKVVLPRILGRKGELFTHLQNLAIQCKEDDALGNAVTALTRAFDEFRKKCFDKLKSTTIKPEIRDQVCATLIRERSGSENALTHLLRLVLVLTLTKNADESLVRAGKEAYMQNPEMLHRILGPVFPPRLAEYLASECYAANAHHTAASDWRVFCERMKGQQESSLPGLATGLAPFDELTGGLFDLMVLAGDTGSGKTTLAQQLAVGALKLNPDVGVLFIDAEMGKDSLNRRLLSREAEIDQRQLFASDIPEADRRRVAEAHRRIKETILPRYWIEALDQVHPPLITFQWLRNLVSTWQERWKTNSIILVLDSLQKLPIADERPAELEAAHGPRQRFPEGELARMRIELLLQFQRWSRQISSPGGFPLLVTSRIRKPTSSGRLERADVFGGVDIVFDASAVLLLEQAGEQRANGITSSVLNIAKIRDYGACGDINLDFDFKHSMFREVGRPTPKSVGPRQVKSTRYRGKS